MNKIYKVMYSKVKQCAVVVSEIAKSHGHNEGRSAVRKHTALTAAVLVALGMFSFLGMPTAQADGDLQRNDFVAANDNYWYWDAKANNGNGEWEKEKYSDLLIGHRDSKDTSNYKGAGAKGPGAITAGVYAQAGEQTVTIGNRNAGASKGSVFVGEHSGYNNGTGNDALGDTNNYVTSVGFESDATGWGSIAIGSNATAANSIENTNVVDHEGNENTTNNKDDDVYGIKKNPSITGASVALGYSAKAQDGNIAIGSYSDTKEGTTKNKTAYTDKEAATSYVSVGNKEKKLQRRITNVADGADATDVATVGQLQKAITDTGVNNKANIDASNIGTNLKQADGITAAELTDITTNENKWGAAIGTGKVADPTKSGKNDPTQNGSQQLVTGGTVYTALQNQKNDLTKDLSVHADWGITITNNYIGLSRNLGNIVKTNGERDPSVKIGRYGLILGGEFSRYISYFNRTPLRNTQYGASGDNSVIVGGFDNLAKGSDSVVLGGWLNEATGKYSSVLGGYENVVEGSYSTIMGGHDNFITGTGVANGASIVGGYENVAFAGAVVIGGFGNHAGNNSVDYLPIYSVAIGGSGNQAVGDCSVALGGGGSNVYADGSTGIGGGSTAYEAYNSLAAGPDSTVTVSNGTAIGYKATTNQKGTIAFGHDKGDIYFDTNPRYDVGDALARWPQKAYRVSQNFYDANGKKITENEYMALMNPDYTWNDYSKRPYFEETYNRAYYNRLVKVADGQKAHDTVVMEQLTPYTKSNASNIGVHLKTYTVGEDGETITEADATPEKQKENKEAWGQALGAGTFTTGTSDKATDASTSDQLVTGKTLYDYDKPTDSQNYVNVNNTTGQNLSALDTQVKANTDALTKPNHNIKYYAVDETTLPKLTNFNGKDYSNEKNNGAVGMGSIAAGFNTHADGIASTVAGSYSGVLNQDSKGAFDLRGATALSYGTFNVNKNTDSTKAVSGVANSIIGQANVTTDSNAAIIYGAGNTVTNSYRDIDTSKVNLNKVKQDLKNKDVAAVIQDAQKAVPASGGQVMVMGGGNNVESAYMTQVVGVGNTVKGNQVNNDNGEWVTDTSDTAINGYDKDKSSQYNYVDGFNNEVINGKHDYIIGANNTLTGDSYDDDSVKPIKKSNQSNIVIGDNHTLDRKKNTVIIGSSDTANTVTNGSDAVIIGHNANAASDTGADNAVAIGLSAKAAGGNAVSIGANTSAGDNSITIGSEASAVSGSNLAIGRYARVYGNKVTNAVALGQNAKALVTDGVAIGSGSQATVKGGSVEGYDPATGNDSEDTTATWKATKGAVSIGTADGKVTRQINGLAAGTNDTDAVNVAQLKKLNGMKANVVADNIGTKLNAGSTDEEKAAQQTNLNAWGTAIGTGTVAANNGQLVTGGTVFNETRISAKDDNGQTKTYKYLDVNASAGKNLEALDSALQTVNTTAGAHTALTIEGGTPAGTKDDQNKDVYAGKNILLHESTDDTTGKVTYDLKLAKDINIGTPGKDGEDGKIGIDGRDGHIGLNGSDGITVRGLDGENGAPGKDGVTITGPKGADGIDGKVGISGTDGKDAVSISGKDGVGHIGLTGPAGTNGKDGTNAIDITVKNGYDGANGINGKNGVDGTSLTRIVYTDNTGEHQVATMEDGLKFKGDGDTVIKKKLNNTMEIIGGAKGDLTEGNIGVNSTTDGKLKVQLAKDLTGITSIGNQTTGAKITFGSDGKTTITGGDVDVNGGKITNVGSGIKKDANGKYTVTDQNKGNAANIGDVQNMVNDAVNSATDTTNKALAGKANIDASNIGANLKGADGKAASTEKQKTNAENWGSAIGTGKIEANDGRMVTGETIYDEVRPKEDGNYVKKDKTTGDNLSALDSKIGKLDETKTYNYIDSKSTTSISDNLGKLDTQVKTNAENIENNTKSIQNITNNVKNLSDNAVQYDKDTNKTKVTLGGEGGTTITNVKEGVLSDKSTDAVNGKQLYAEQQARKELETKVTSNTTEINNIKDGKGFSDKGKEAIRDLAKGSVKVIAGTNTTVTPGTDKEDGAKTYAVNVEGKGNIASGDTGLISGDTLYKEVHVDKDGTYIKSQDSATDKDMTVAQNLSALDKGLKTTSDLIHTNDKGDIQIGGSSTATKIDVSGKDAKGNTTGRFITGVVTDAGDPTSAANVGYVNGVTAANTQQIYRDMNNAYGRLNNNINKAAAGSNALAALHPLDYDPDDKADFAVGYGHYRNANAAAVGAFYHPNENTMVNVGVSLGNGDPGFNAGVSFKIGSGSAGHQAMSKTEMAKVINSQSKEIDALKKDNADKDKRIDALEQKMAEILTKLDKNGK